MTAELENLKVWHTAHCAQIGRWFEGWNCYLYKWCNESYIYWNSIIKSKEFIGFQSSSKSTRPKADFAQWVRAG